MIEKASAASPEKTIAIATPPPRQSTPLSVWTSPGRACSIATSRSASLGRTRPARRAAATTASCARPMPPPRATASGIHECPRRAAARRRVETAAYFVVAEGLTNVAKYAEATYASVAVRRENGYAVVEIRDDGVGGADAAGGSGLLGLGDRVGALDGTIELESPRGHGTVLRARIPLAP